MECGYIYLRLKVGSVAATEFYSMKVMFSLPFSAAQSAEVLCNGSRAKTAARSGKNSVSRLTRGCDQCRKPANQLPMQLEPPVCPANAGQQSYQCRTDRCDHQCSRTETVTATSYRHQHVPCSRYFCPFKGAVLSISDAVQTAPMHSEDTNGRGESAPMR